MGAFIGACRRVSGWMNVLGECCLFVMMMFTVIDVALRLFGTPITGTYELVAVMSAIVIGYAVPQTSLDGGHIFVDFLLEHRSRATRMAFFAFTRLLGIALFALLAGNLVVKGNDLYMNGDVSQTLHVPYYPVAYALALCFFVECFVLVADALATLGRGTDHE